MVRSRRVPIPADVAARVIFRSHRTCCVCRDPRKPIQIHHIDGDPSNNDPANLAVLCLECHNDTQLSGGFGRRLDADQVVVYRDDWYALVARRREADVYRPDAAGPPPAAISDDPELVTSLAELFRERKEWWELALVYHRIGNEQLRDKYLERALQEDDSDEALIRARLVQGRLREVPSEVIDRHLDTIRSREIVDWSYVSRILLDVGRPLEATRALLELLERALDDDRTFTVGFYLRDASLGGLVEALFLLSLQKAQEADDLWWQVRPLQELGWTDALRELLDRNADRIKAEGPVHLQQLLAEYRGDIDEVRSLELQEARDFIAYQDAERSQTTDDGQNVPDDPPSAST